MLVPKAPIPVGYAKVEALGTFGPATWANVFYVDMTPSDPGEAFVAMDLAKGAIKNLMTAFLDSLSTNWQVTRYRVTYRGTSSDTYTTTIADAATGTAGAGYQDAQVAYLINWASGDPRKGGKPRQYIVGVPDSAVADSARIDPTQVTEISADINEWLATFPLTSGSAHCVGLVEMSFRNGNAWRTDAAPRPIVAGSLNPVVATQRRRVDRLRS